MDVRIMPGKLSGTVRIPPSKSAAHRAILAATLAKGESVIENVDLSNDISATLAACNTLGSTADIAPDGRYNTVTIRGGLNPTPSATLDCAESGSTLRFLIPVACAKDGERIFTGHGRLPQRPLDAYLQIFDEQGIRYTRPYGYNLPMAVTGSLHSGHFQVDGRVSSQYVTGLLYALPLLSGDSTVEVIGGFESRGYVDLTIDMLRRFGVQVQAERDTFTVRGNQAYKPQRIAVEGDWSQAAFFLVVGAISGGVRVAGFDGNSLQPDSVIAELLMRMGADLSWEGDEFVSAPAQLHGVEIDVSQCPDLVPPLAIAAAFAEGTTHITGAARLRIKESDRLHALAQNLLTLGVRAEEEPDGLVIHGGTMTGGEIDSFGDHRIAMAFAVAGAASKQGVTIRGAHCVEKSYPKFFEDFADLGGKVE